MNGPLDKHIQSAHELKKCSLCDASFKKATSLKKHMSTVHEEKKHEDKGAICNICEKSFSSEHNFEGIKRRFMKKR
jgi:uncharacterized protein with PIN domain